MKYAGIGSRETPQWVLDRMVLWGVWFARNNIMLRSGKAKGADTAFETGANVVNPVWYVFESFTARDAELSDYRNDWLALAEKFHPAWERCSPFAKLLHARNGPIVLGEKLNDPVDFVCCWTKDGKASGGTGQALRIAEAYNIPIFNWFDPTCEARLQQFLDARL